MAEHPVQFHVEPMRLADVAAVAELEKKVFTLPWSAHAFDYELRYNRTAHFLVVRACSENASGSGGQADTGGEPARELVAFAGYWHIVDEVHICTLAVHPDYRQLGLASLLLLRIMDQARGLSADVATLEVRVSNDAAIRLYDKFGFSVVGRRKAYYSDNREDAYIMTTGSLSSRPMVRQLDALRAELEERLGPEAGAAADDVDSAGGRNLTGQGRRY